MASFRHLAPSVDETQASAVLFATESAMASFRHLAPSVLETQASLVQSSAFPLASTSAVFILSHVSGSLAQFHASLPAFETVSLKSSQIPALAWLAMARRAMEMSRVRADAIFSCRSESSNKSL